MIHEITVLEDHVLVTLSGSMYMSDAAQLRENLLVYLDKGNANFIVDLGGLDYIDSAGLGTLVAIQKRALQQGGEIIIRGLKGLVKELFELTRLTSVFQIQ